MLQFFKKPGQKDKGTSSRVETKSASADEKSQHAMPICNLNEKEEEEICAIANNDMCNFQSRLSKTLPQILADKSALGYFIQFMDAKDSIALVKFWLEVECLCGAMSEQQSNGRCAYDVNEEKQTNYEMPKSNKHFSNSEDKRLINTRQDALLIYKKYIASNALGPNRITEQLLAEMRDNVESQRADKLIQNLCDAQQIVYRILEDEYLESFLRSSFNCKHQIDVLTNGSVQLADILYDETAFFYFIEFMEQENKREMLDFWMSAINYKQNVLEKNDPVEAQSDALVIYEKYFSLQATTPLGMSNAIRFEIEKNICSEDGKGPGPNCFDKPCLIVYHYFVKYYLPAFLSSQLYYKYLSELISIIQNSMCSDIKPRLQRTDSDCSSEISSLSAPVSFSSKSDKDKTKIKGIASCSGSMNIDTKQLYDPDSLWKRNKKSLSVGYIDNMGRFVTEIEPEPRRKRDNESRLSRAVKKLVHLEQDETKEELAWKIAEMIVGDITSQTLGSSRFSS